MSTIKNKLDLVSEHARERLGMPEGWACYAFAWVPPTKDPKFLHVKGAVAPLIAKGPRKGQRNWQKRDRATEREDWIPREAQDAYDAAWSARTGLCVGCLGRGETFRSWSKAEGTKYATCRDCGGTGRAPGAPPAEARAADLPGQLTMFGGEREA